MTLKYSGDVARDLLVDELISINRRIEGLRNAILHGVEHGVGLREAVQRRRLRGLREALAHRALVRDLERGLAQRDAERP